MIWGEAKTRQLKEASIRTARETIADAPHHSDAINRSACETLLHLSRDHTDHARANNLLAVLDRTG